MEAMQNRCHTAGQKSLNANKERISAEENIMSYTIQILI